ncbi:MAG: hemolysin family protein [Candidatus Pacebacteria bacterium]|nr:hemolysin family protein [Candidatus Paceibacterota bacterium]
MEIIFFTLLLLGSAFFSGAETAFFSLHQSTIQDMVEKKYKNAKLIQKLKNEPDRLLTTILIGNNVVNIIIASYATLLSANYFGSMGIGIATGLTTIAILIFGEIMPKSFAFSHNKTFTKYMAPILYGLTILVYPISSILVSLNKFLQKITKANTMSLVTENEVRIMSKMSAESGEIHHDEHELIENVFRFDDMVLGSIMTPFQDISFINGDVPVDNIAYYVSHTEHSRYPVYINEESNIIGYIHVNTIMKVLNSDERDTLVSQYVTEIERIPEDLSIRRVFKRMRHTQNHMMLVTKKGEPEHVLGLVTMENILEELVGEIQDETDTE